MSNEIWSLITKVLSQVILFILTLSKAHHEHFRIFPVHRKYIIYILMNVKLLKKKKEETTAGGIND